MNIHHAVNGITEMVTYDWLQVSLVSISMYTFAICWPEEEEIAIATVVEVRVIELVEIEL